MVFYLTKGKNLQSSQSILSIGINYYFYCLFYIRQLLKIQTIINTEYRKKIMRVFFFNEWSFAMLSRLVLNSYVQTFLFPLFPHATVPSVTMGVWRCKILAIWGMNARENSILIRYIWTVLKFAVSSPFSTMARLFFLISYYSVLLQFLISGFGLSKDLVRDL
jgi:hypothetical protein